MIRCTDSVSRRSFLRQSLSVGSAVVLTAPFFAGCRQRQAQQRKATIRFAAPSSYDLPDWGRLKRDLGHDLRFVDNGNDVGPVLSRMLTGTMARDFDVQGLQGGAETELAARGVIRPWNLELIPRWSSVWESAKDIAYCTADGQRYGIPIALNADSIIYLPDEIKTVPGYESGVVDSYAAIFDPRLAGRTSMEDAWINSAIFTAIYLKGSGQLSIKDPGNLTAEELREVMGFLIDKKRAGQFKRFWKGWEQGVQLIRSGEVVAMTGWEPIVKALQEQGMNAQYAVPREGYEGWANTLLLHVGAEEGKIVKEVHEFANWLLSGYYGCSLLKLRGYVVPADTTLPYARENDDFDAKTIEEGLENVRRKLNDHKVYWQNVRPHEHRLYDEWWERLRNA